MLPAKFVPETATALKVLMRMALSIRYRSYVTITETRHWQLMLDINERGQTSRPIVARSFAVTWAPVTDAD